MKIRIVKSGNRWNWYSNKIGETFEAISETSYLFSVKLNCYHNAHILKEDCEEVKETSNVISELAAAVGVDNETLLEAIQSICVKKPIQTRVAVKPYLKNILYKKSRSEIVYEAIQDVKDLRESHGKFEYKIHHHVGTNAKFIVNSDKRTVVCLLIGYGAGTLLSRGIAKCDPDDCFNEHVGKIIALRRALGKDVPEKYLTLPKPEGVSVGDYVQLYNENSVPFDEFMVVDIDEHDRVGSEHGHFYRFEPEITGDRVINDSARYK